MMYKAPLTLLLVLCTTCTLMGQGNIGLGTTTPHTSALLHMESVTKGLLVPRMTTAQRVAITDPATGLMVYDLTTGSFWYYRGSSWSNMAAPRLISDADGDTRVLVELLPDEDRIRFEVNGTEAMHINPEGRVGIGTPIPMARLHLTGGAMLLTGSVGGTPVTGSGTRLMWIPEKGAFRAGSVGGSQWNDENVGDQSFVAGGSSNTASGSQAFVGGGSQHTGAGPWSFIGGGFQNHTVALDVFIGGGTLNMASGGRSFIGGGQENMTSESNAFIAGGTSNTASGVSSMVGAGAQNTASGLRAVVSGGIFNTAISEDAFVGGGAENDASALRSFIGGGQSNGTHAAGSFIGGGQGNSTFEPASFIGGGLFNHASGTFAFVGGGRSLRAQSFAEAVFGQYCLTLGGNRTDWDASDPLFVIGNGTSDTDRANAITVRKNGNTGIGTATPGAYQVWVMHGDFGLRLQNSSVDPGSHWEFWQNSVDNLQLYTGSGNVGNFNAATGVYSSTSDRSLKQDIKLLDPVLPSLRQLRVNSYTYLNDPKTERHIGLIAQEVETLFPELVTLPSNDAGREAPYLMNYAGFGVLAVKGVQELADRIESLEDQVAALQMETSTLRTQLDQILSALATAGIAMER